MALKDHMVTASIGTLAAIAVSVISYTMAYADREAGQNERITTIEAFVDQGGRFTREDGVQLKADLIHRLDRMEDKIDLIISNQ